MKEDCQNSAAVIFGSNLRKLRRERHLTQEKLAEALGISTKHVGDLESGKSFVSGDKLDAIASYFGVGYDELFLTENQIKGINIEAAKMASEMLRRNSEAFDKHYGIELKLKENRKS